MGGGGLLQRVRSRYDLMHVNHKTVYDMRSGQQLRSNAISSRGMTLRNLAKQRVVTISEFDHLRLQELLLVAKQFASPQPDFIHDLESELRRASIVPPEQIPPYVVTMNTQVRLIDADTGEARVYTLVFPSDADLENGKLSILSELGVAILGYRVGDTIEWEFTEGRKRIRIGMICFQPEATRQYEL